MSKSNTWENDLLLLLFNNTNASLIGDATGLRGASTAGNLYISLHTANPDETGTQTSSEATYGGYARKAVARSGAGWTVTGNAVTNAAAITFDPASSGTNTITHFGVGTDASGTGKLLYKGALTPSISVSTGIAPNIPAGDLDITED
jgi:hypothetical protein